jgi:type II secretory pathway component GspD/PulD (secretin)
MPQKLVFNFAGVVLALGLVAVNTPAVFSQSKGPLEAYDNEIPMAVPLSDEASVNSQKSEQEALPDDIDKGMKVDNGRISLDLKGIDMLEFFKILSLKIGKSIVPTKGVSGRASFFLNDLIFEDALDVILISQDLACERKGKVIYVMASAEYERLYGKKYNEKRKYKGLKINYAKPQAIFNALGQIKSDIGKIILNEATGTLILLDIPEKLELMKETVRILDQPLKTVVFDLKYAKPADIKAQLTLSLTPGAGEIYTDDRSNRVVVTDLSQKIEEFKKLVDTFDVKALQVFIEAEIVQVVLNNHYQRGVDWEKVFGQSNLKDLDLLGKFPVTPSLSSYQKVSIGKLSRDNFTSALNLLKTYGDTKILSRPRISALNNKEAKIMVGAREAYVSQTLSQAETTTVTSESIQFIDVGVKLNVVPVINKDGFITMNIKPEISTLRETITTALGSRVPIVETSEAETVVTVKDGTMIMIAGLMKEEKRDETLGVPILSRIPVLGGLFGSRSKQKKNTELVIFLTPHIITGETSLEGIEPAKMALGKSMPENLKKAVIIKELEKVKAKPLATLPPLPEPLVSTLKKDVKNNE